MASAVVIGAGHNGLIAAIRLARAGVSVTLCERSSEVGGLAQRGLLPSTAQVAPEVLAEIGVTVPWRAAPKLHGMRADGTTFAVQEDPGWQQWVAFSARYRVLARSLLLNPPPRLRTDAPLWPMAKAAIGLRRLGEADMMTLLRVAPTSAEDALAEHIADPAVRAVAAGAGLLGTWMGPLSPTGAAVLLLDQALSGQEIDGGGPALAQALEAAARTAGVTLRLDAPVVGTTLADGRVTGVRLQGETLAADAVVACCDPRTALLDLVRPQDLPVRVEYQAQEHRVRGLVAVVHLELREGPQWNGTPVELLHTATHPHDVERAFDGGKNRKLPDAAPVLLRTAPDQKSATAWVNGVSMASRCAGDLREAVLDRTLTALSRVWPGARDAITGHEVLTPEDLTAKLGLAGGHLWHGELALDQLWAMRPGLDLSGHRTPISGLFLGSSGTHPTGGLTGIPGLLAARAVLEGQ